MRSSSHNHPQNIHSSLPPQPPYHREDPSSTLNMDHHSSNNTSANTSRHTSTASIFSLNPFHHSNSRNSTPPTPTCSPGLFIPPPYPPPDVNVSTEAPHRLHPTQYRMLEKPVRETHSLDLAFDPISGRKHVNHYSIIEEIGRGVHGKVKLGADLERGGLVAIKIVERSQGRPRLGRRGDAREAEMKVRREIAILKKCRHENVVRLLEVIDDPQSKKVYLILEYVQLGEIAWRAKGDPDVVRRERHRLRQQLRETTADDNKEEEKLRRPKRKKAQFWSLEFASDSESSETSSYRVPKLPRLPSTNTVDIPPLDSDNDQFNPSSSNTDGYSSDSDSSVEDWSYVPTLTIEQARCTFRDTVLGLEYLHYHGIIHRDIKPANLLWTHDHRVKISDFGVSFLGRPIRDDDGDGTEDEDSTGLEQNELELAKTAGTPAFFAPELCHVDPDKPRPQITCAIDVWALGVTLYCLIFARCPFMADSEFALLQSIAKDELVIPKRRLRPQQLPMGRSHLTPPAPKELLQQETEPIDPDLQDLLKRLLTKDPSRRITLKEVKRHPWVLLGIIDPCKWVDDTDPERLSHGNKIQVTTEDVEKAVSNAGMLGRARSAIKKAGDWYKGLRKRASSTANVLTMSSNKDRDDIPEMNEVTRCLQLSTLSKDDSDKELQWMGRINGWREEDRLHPLATATTTSTGSSDTVHAQHFGGYDGTSDFLSMRAVGPGVNNHGYEENRLRRKCSANLGGPLLCRHATSNGNQAGSTKSSAAASPYSASHDNVVATMKAESTAATVIPNVSNGGLFGSNIVKRMVRSVRSGNLAGDASEKREREVSSTEGHPLCAKEALAGALHANQSGFPNGNDALHVQIPYERRPSYVSDDMEAGASKNVSPRSAAFDVKERIEKDRRDRVEDTRRILGKFSMNKKSQKPCPPSPDDEIAPEIIWEREIQKQGGRDEERRQYSQPSAIHDRTPPGWIREAYYHHFHCNY